MIQMDYNMCNKQRREQGRSTEQPSPLPLRWNNIRKPVYKVSQSALTILMRNRYRICSDR